METKEDLSRELEKISQETCRSYGGSNCALHQCMFKCALQLRKEEIKAELSKEENSEKERQIQD